MEAATANGTHEAPLLLPHNLEAEESVLGAMMVSEAAIDPVVLEVRLEADDFYRGRHATVFRAIHELYERSQPVDALTVSELLTSQGKLDEAGGRDAVSALASSTPVPGNAGHYAQIVKQNSLLRRLLGAAQKIQVSVQTRGSCSSRPSACSSTSSARTRPATSARWPRSSSMRPSVWRSWRAARPR